MPIMTEIEPWELDNSPGPEDMVPNYYRVPDNRPPMVDPWLTATDDPMPF